MMRGYAVNEVTKQCAVLSGGDECSTVIYHVPNGWKYLNPGEEDAIAGCPVGYQQVSLPYKVKPYWQFGCLVPGHSGSNYTLYYFWFRIVAPVVLSVIIGWVVLRKLHSAK